VLFSVQLGGGTDINRAMGYCASRITRPEDTILARRVETAGREAITAPKMLE
jgi:hypothetical protein